MTDSNRKPDPDVLDYEASVAAAKGEVRRLLKGAPALIRPMTSHLARASGKLIRARTLLACALRRDSSVSPDAVKAAAAVELLHLATLVHDDILDDADSRRGIDALHRKFGDKYAVLCGDFLFCTAIEFVSTANAPEHRKNAVDRSVPKYLTQVLMGELRQDQNYKNYSLSEREYFRIIGGKTAALFEAACYAGFLFSDEEDAAKDIYREIGNTIGLIFQLNDDCADFEASARLIKKPVLSDYSRGVITLPLIHALKKDHALLQKIEAGLEPEALKDAVEAAGGLSYTHSKAESLYKKSDRLIESLDIGAEKLALLKTLLRAASGKTA
jgi:geranylgeranyl pyrophosphate synthase